MSMLVNVETGEIAPAPLDRAEAERITTRIRLRLDAIADNYVAVMPLIREAIERGAWVALGYNGVSQYVSEHLKRPKGGVWRAADFPVAR